MRWQWWLHRLSVLWKFIKLRDEARTLELEIQNAKQKRDDMAFAGKKDEYLYQQGYADGIDYCLKRFK